MQAEITLAYDDAKTAEAVAHAISPDNAETPRELTVTTVRIENRVVSHIAHRGRLSTFIATIDDILFCASAAEKALNATKKQKPTTRL